MQKLTTFLMIYKDGSTEKVRAINYSCAIVVAANRRRKNGARTSAGIFPVRGVLCKAAKRLILPAILSALESDRRDGQRVVYEIGSQPRPAPQVLTLGVGEP